MFGTLAHCTHEVDKFILGWHFRKNLAHLYLAFFVFVLKPFILFISANCQANFLTLLIISWKPAFETLQSLQQSQPHPLKNNIFQFVHVHFAWSFFGLLLMITIFA